MPTLLRCIVRAGGALRREGFFSSSENERKMSVTTKIIMRQKMSFLKSSSEKFTFYSQPSSIERTAHSEDLEEAKLWGLLQPRLCVQPAEECLMEAMEEEDGEGKGCVSPASSSLHFSACRSVGLRYRQNTEFVVL